MYGKAFASMYEGSMFGAGATVFAVWGYVIAKTVKNRVELNPAFLAAVIGESAKDIEKAIEKLCAPDPTSRNKEHQGRRLVKEGQFQYIVPSHDHYRRICDEDARREYNAMKQREYRSKHPKMKTIGSAEERAAMRQDRREEEQEQEA